MISPAQIKPFAQFVQARRNEATEKAQAHALEIIKSDYPESLKRPAREYLSKIGHAKLDPKDRCLNEFYSLLSKGRGFIDFHDPERWLPWRLIADANSLEITEDNKIRIQEQYRESHLKIGDYLLNFCHHITTQKVAVVISPYFDCNHYRTIHSDMRYADDVIALNHYSLHGYNEPTRSPNPLFRNAEFSHLYPWTSELKINPLYLFVRWHEQFSEYKNILLKRCLIAKRCRREENSNHSFATIAPRVEGRHEYQRIHYLVKRYSNPDKRIKPDLNRLNIHIVIPDFTEGGGGHMTIFRMVSYLEKSGHQCTLWVKDYISTRHPLGPTRSATDYYLPIRANVLPLSSHFAFTTGDALIATGWDTVEIVKSHRGFHEYFYLVQDFEPYFFARGSEALQAEATYKKDIKTICASSWLSDIMKKRYGRTSTHFDLSFDPSIYFPATNRQSTPATDNRAQISSKSKPIISIAFYARHRTARRAVALALEGLSRVKQDRFILCVELFGERKGEIQLPENVVGFDNGILTHAELANLYRSCDIGLTFSATNYALVPQEMMACGLPVIEIDNDSTRAIYPDDILAFAEPSAESIALKIEELGNNPELRHRLRENALKWVENTSWEKSFCTVTSFIQNEVMKTAAAESVIRLSDYYLRSNYESVTLNTIPDPSATVVIPIHNGGTLLLHVIERILEQRIYGGFECILIDSGSDDGSVQKVPHDPRISIYRIPKSSFQHGGTRNLGVALAKAPFVAFLTQDAIPKDETWLSNLVRPLQENPEVAGVFGRHLGHDDHPEFIKLSINQHFDAFLNDQVVCKDNNLRSYYDSNPQYRQRLHYYSDNNSCLRKDVWLKYPYPDVPYGEDQLWADWVIQWGHKKAYAHDAVVKHSHFYSEREEFERSVVEAHFFYMFFGYNLSQDRLTLEQGVQSEAQKILLNNSQSLTPYKSELLAILRAKVEGYQQGVKEALHDISANF